MRLAWVCQIDRYKAPHTNLSFSIAATPLAQKAPFETGGSPKSERTTATSWMSTPSSWMSTPSSWKGEVPDSRCCGCFVAEDVRRARQSCSRLYPTVVVRTGCFATLIGSGHECDDQHNYYHGRSCIAEGSALSTMIKQRKPHGIPETRTTEDHLYDDPDTSINARMAAMLGRSLCDTPHTPSSR